ncbi:hypothetical protein AYR62_00600 [Secundilactobacillus paracollinoides]|uniref:HTH merR-type domain-containing protein n=2 Tax=Secundilactobacillus paracollinoides TaxID=240427 RepID=A0A1B2IVQ0_9LACO|nr:hypothetical protein AYR61_02150 [Secundilactobacillus paracollinoides]ANZ62742.1 hypothetical protein AYR62_00600 [Secundilactobacillus paracollinoides]ANZ66101.1 hypothetical protein AYR63_02350 [Secundilactobacillus paracollinoides]
MTTIKEVAKLTGVSPYAIRFYEREGLLDVPRTKSGIRNFDDASVNAVIAIAHYRNVGMSLEGIRQIFANYDDHELSVKLLKDTKKRLDAQISALESTRDYLINKIALHQQIADKERIDKNGKR